MTHWRFENLPAYAFPRLRALLNNIEPAADGLPLQIGEPKHPFPDFVQSTMLEAMADFGRYPPNEGTPEFQTAIQTWLSSRYGLSKDSISEHLQIVPVSGTREGLFMIAQAVTPPDKNGKQPVFLLPNPFYQCYAAAAASVSAEAIYVEATAATGFLPRFDLVEPEILERTTAVYVCSPANPQGTVADLNYWQSLIELAIQYNFTIIADECYSEIYVDKAPTGILEAAFSANASFNSYDAISHFVTFNSLSKRSNLPGLRSGFAAGNKIQMERFAMIRSYGGAPSPLPVYATAAAAWSDEKHVEQNRALYREKFECAKKVFGNHPGFQLPQGGFFLWFDVSTIGKTGEQATLDLWQKAGIKVLPGAYLARTVNGFNPGDDYIRIALVHPTDQLEKSLIHVNQILS